MERLLARSIVCFGIFLSPTTVAGLGVQQLPTTASAPAGSSITLSCSFPSHNRSRAQVTWARGSGEAAVLDPSHPFYRGRLDEGQRQQQGRAEATVTLSELTERDSDLYRCYITHPQGQQETGTGTALTVTGRDALSVSQLPRSLSATAGENVTLSCTFETGKDARVKVLWLRGSGEDVELDSHHPFYRGRLRVSRLDEHRQGRATLSLAELQEWDSGLYRCCVQTHGGQSGLGGGTQLSVMPTNQSGVLLGHEPLYYRAIVSLSLTILFSLGIILSLQPRSDAGSAQNPPSLPVPNGRTALLCGPLGSPCSTPEPVASPSSP
nr:immunoglobulin superfamily member 3-like [Pelodiscus sinensis]|eukprot:XP_014424150.1 immunoglobulin superfamily member 3-like [Pelodiscus sinensis]